jgi:hypothetical protein
MATIVTSKNRPTIQARDAKIIAGIQKRLQNVPSIVLDGVSYTPTTLAAFFQSQIDSANAVSTAKSSWLTAVQSDRVLAAKVRSALIAFQTIVRSMFANAPDALADFGFTPRKTATSTLLTKVVAAEKRQSTREARHTVGAKAKLSIKGDVTSSDIAASVAAKIEPPQESTVAGSPAPAAPSIAPSAVTAAREAVVSAPNGAPAMAVGPGTHSA